MLTLSEILEDIHTLNQNLAVFEDKYGLLSETFYSWYTQGQEPEDESWMLDFVEWAGLYKILLDRQADYHAVIQAATANSQRGIEVLIKQVVAA